MDSEGFSQAGLNTYLVKKREPVRPRTERRLERRHLTQSGDRDDDRPRVFADYGYLSGDSTPLLGVVGPRNGVSYLLS